MSNRYSFGILIWLILTPASYGQELGSNPVITTLNSDAIKVIVTALRLKDTREVSRDRQQITFASGDHTLRVSEEGSKIQISTLVAGELALSKVNEWNQLHHLATAYIDSHSRPALSATLSVKKGVTMASVTAFADDYGRDVEKFRSFAKNSTDSRDSGVDLDRPAGLNTQLQRYKPAFGSFVMVVDQSKWKTIPSDAVGTLTFQHIDGAAYARIISERLTFPLQTLKVAALANMRMRDPNLQVIEDKMVRIGGRSVVQLKAEFSYQNMPFTFYGYCYSGSSGSIQVWTYTPRNLFTETEPIMAAFLKGLEISDEELPSTTTPSVSVLPLLNNGASFAYDTQKWKLTQNESGRIQLAKISGEVHALVVSERLTVPFDSLPTIAITNARQADPNAEITFRERRRVKGGEVWYLKMSANISGIPFSYTGVYGSNTGGTVQVLAFCAKQFAQESEKDIEAFLGGLSLNAE